LFRQWQRTRPGLADGVIQEQPKENRSGHRDAATRLAPGHAAGPKTGARIVGDSNKAGQLDRAGFVYGKERFDRVVTRLHQEDAKNARTRFTAGATEAGNTVSKGKNIGTDFAEFLSEEGLLEDAQAVAIKRVIAWQLDQLMKRQAMTKVELARRMNTSRAALDRLLDPENPSVTLHTLHSAAKAVGGRLNVSLEVPGG